jgi:hypothetical protein
MPFDYINVRGLQVPARRAEIGVRRKSVSAEIGVRRKSVSILIFPLPPDGSGRPADPCGSAIGVDSVFSRYRVEIGSRRVPDGTGEKTGVSRHSALRAAPEPMKNPGWARAFDSTYPIFSEPFYFRRGEHRPPVRPIDRLRVPSGPSSPKRPETGPKRGHSSITLTAGQSGGPSPSGLAPQIGDHDRSRDRPSDRSWPRPARPQPARPPGPLPTEPDRSSGPAAVPARDRPPGRPDRLNPDRS